MFTELIDYSRDLGLPEYEFRQSADVALPDELVVLLHEVSHTLEDNGDAILNHHHDPEQHVLHSLVRLLAPFGHGIIVILLGGTP